MSDTIPVTNLETQSIVLVGLIGGNPSMQVYLGTFCIPWRNKEPVLQYTNFNSITNDGKNEINRVDFYHSPRHGDSFTFDTWVNGHGLRIHKDGDVWKYTTGLKPYDSGSCGILNGGDDMKKMYDLYISQKLKE